MTVVSVLKLMLDRSAGDRLRTFQLEGQRLAVLAQTVPPAASGTPTTVDSRR